LISAAAGAARRLVAVAIAISSSGALAAYRDRGERGSSEIVAGYYRRCQMEYLLEQPGFAS
jgi:hypothetical protein